MEILILALVFGGVVKYGVTDLLYAAKGKPHPRYETARARSADRTERLKARARRGRGRTGGGPGPLRCYLSTLWADAWTDATTRHAAKRVRPDSAATRSANDRPRGAARVFLDGLTGDVRRAARRQWDLAWTRADERRRERTTHVRPETVVVPGEVVDPADTESPAAPAATPSPASSTAGSASSTDPAFGRRFLVDDGRTDLRFSDDPTDPNGVRDCAICEGEGVWDGRPCPSCSARQRIRAAHWDAQSAHNYAGPNPVRRTPPTREEELMLNPTSNTDPAVPTSTAPAPRKVIDMSSLNTTDLSNLDQVDAEISQARDAFEVLIEAQDEALSWAQNLPDRWAGTDFDTAGLQAAIAGVAEAVQHGVNGDSLEALSRVESEIKQARTVGEIADSADATGNVGSFRAS